MIAHFKEVKHVLLIALAANLVMAISKCFIGYRLNALSMMADGAHSVLDAGASLLGLFSIYFAAKPSDPNHHYGHYKFEYLASLGIAALIGLTAWEVLKHALGRIFFGHELEFKEVYQLPAIGVMLCSLCANFIVAKYEKKKATEYQSLILKADALHTSSDIWVTCAVLFSILCGHLKIPHIDAAISVLIALYLVWVSFKIVRHLTMVLSDAAFIDRNRVRKLVKSVKGVQSCHHIRTRGVPGNAFVDLHIQVPPDMTTVDSHRLAHEIERRIKDEITGIHDVLIHTEPYPDPDDEEG